MSSTEIGIVSESLNRLEAWLERHQYRGWDPHDGLNSPVLRPFALKNRYLGASVLQLFRRLPINLRPVFSVGRQYNPKGVGLFLSGYVTRYRHTGASSDLRKIRDFASWLERNVCDGYDECCWGYNFDWPNRAFYAPRGTPTVVSTCFVANAFLDAYGLLREQKFLEIGRSSCEFITRRLNRTLKNGCFCFSYTPLDNTRIHNANVLAAALLSRVHFLSADETLRETSDRAVAYTVRCQNSNGSWYYGEAGNQEWIDLFHTGYILEGLEDYMTFTGARQYEEALRKGWDFFSKHFILEDGIPKYYHDHLYPIDIHCSAQAILTLLRLRHLDCENVRMATKVALWAINNMQSPDGHFYYQKHRFYTNRIPYVRWSQAWMFQALTSLLANGYGQSG